MSEVEKGIEKALKPVNLRGAERFHMEPLPRVDSARAVIEAARALRMPAGDIAAAIGQVVKEIKPVPSLNS